MYRGGFTYVAADTPVHRLDARLKIVLLLAYSIAVLALPTWWGLLGCVVVVIAATLAARIPFGTMNKMLMPVYLLAAFSALCNFVAHPGYAGLVAGLYFATRMIALVAGSFVVCLTTTSSDLLDAFASFISPLRQLGVPSDDIAFTLALSVRFIPVIQEEFARIRAAQVSRGAEAAGGMRRKFSIWGNAFAALFVGLFRHADTLAQAMDARCYGAADARSRLPRQGSHRG